MRACFATLTIAALLATGPVPAQVNDPRFASYFLVGRFGEVCTMCEVAVLCQEGEPPPVANSVPLTGDFTIYLLHTRTFWSQVSTIWEWFISNFTPRSLTAGHERPATVYTVTAGAWAPPAGHMLRLSLEPPQITVDDGYQVNRVDRRWQRSGHEPHGYCSRLPLWDTLRTIGERAPRGGNP